MRRGRSVVVLWLAAWSVASPALAADGDVYQAWVAHDSDFCALGKKTRTQTKTWSHSRSKKNENHLLATLASTRDLIKQVIGDVDAQTPSSHDGTRAKTLVQRSNRNFDASIHELARAVRAATSHPGSSGSKAHAHAAGRYSGKATKDEHSARKAFTKAGVAIKKNPDACASQ